MSNYHRYEVGAVRNGWHERAIGATSRYFDALPEAEEEYEKRLQSGDFSYVDIFDRNESRIVRHSKERKP